MAPVMWSIKVNMKSASILKVSLVDSSQLEPSDHIHGNTIIESLNESMNLGARLQYLYLFIISKNERLTLKVDSCLQLLYLYRLFLLLVNI